MKRTITSALLLGMTMGAPALAAPTPDEVMRIPPDLSERLDEQVVQRSANLETRLKLLVNFMFSTDGLAFEYDGPPTRSVADTYENRKGNCLSFTLLFIALARQAGLNVHAREVHAPLAWRREDNTVFSIGHINAGVRIPNQFVTVDFEPDLFLAHRLANAPRSRNVSDERALAHFYNNRGAELLADGELAEARAHLERALRLEPDFAPALNSLGVLERRTGNLEEAERLFLAVLERDAKNTDILLNLIGLYRSTGDQSALETYQARLNRIRPRDPYFQYEMGRVFEDIGDYDSARRHYARAIRRLSDDDRFHFAMARVHYLSGDFDAAVKAFEQALELSREETHGEYLAKLKALKAGHPETRF